MTTTQAHDHTGHDWRPADMPRMYRCARCGIAAYTPTEVQVRCGDLLHTGKRRAHRRTRHETLLGGTP